jgi:membrane-anchored glycerophosphoryl diester phosphodiesterase (GDPDase)
MNGYPEHFSLPMDQDNPPSPDKGASAGSPETSGLGKFWQELRRRKVVRVALTYAIAGWLIIQIAVSTFPSLYIPQWALSFVIMCVVLGFPVALIVAWAFELTTEGIKTTKSAQAEQEDAPVSKKQEKKCNWMAYATEAVIPTLIFGTLALFFYIRADTDSAPEPSRWKPSDS